MKHIDPLKDLKDFEEADLAYSKVAAGFAMIRGKRYFEKFVRRTVLSIYKSALGYKRFLLIDYWKVFFTNPAFKRDRAKKRRPAP